MSINPIKEFFKRRKAEAKFSRAGPGQKLSSDQPESSSSSREQASARQAAAEAAMKRFNKDNTKPAQRPKFATPATVSSQSKLQTSSETKSQDVGLSKATPKETSVATKELLVIDGVAQRDIQVYSTEELARRIKEPDIDDEFFRLTVEDAKLIQQRYNEEREKNEILRTSEMRQREVEAKRPTTNIARLRFKLPNQLVLEASFSGNELLSFVRDWLVAICLDKIELDLQSFDILFGLRPFKGADFDKSVKQLGLIPATTLTVVQKSN